MGGIRLGSLLGFPIHIKFSFLFLMGFALVVWRSLDAVAMLLATFAMVLLHELGHAVLARRLKVPILGIAPAMANTWFSATRERSSALPLQLALTRGKLQPG